MRPGDWFCTVCDEVIYKEKLECFKCGQKKDDSRGKEKNNGGAVPKKFIPSLGDWKCKCKTINKRNNEKCFRCGESITNLEMENVNTANCIACKVNLRQYAFVPCGHLVLCNSCLVNFKKKPQSEQNCLICRSEITLIQRIYIC